jgi:aspartyl-tRNA(Asn)/glutamyl-tRNA(Gln) amidotransferase subunit A
MCRSAEDCGLVMAAIAGPDENDPSAHERGAYRHAGPRSQRPKPGQMAAAVWQPLKGKKLGVVQPDFSRPQNNAEVGKAYAAALEVLKSLGATLEETLMPDFPYGPVALMLYTAEAASIFRPFIESGKVQELVDESQKAGLIAALSIPATDYLDAFRIRGEIQKEMGKVFEKYDAIVAPSRTGLASLVDRPFSGQQQPPPRPAGERPATPPPGAGNQQNVIGSSNIAGLPAISVPCGYSSEKNLPMGIQIVAEALRDDICVEIAMAYQSVTEFHKKRPLL